MKLPKTFFKKLLLGALLIWICAACTTLLKEVLDTRNPESALPVITVRYEYGDQPFSNEREVRRAGWEWSFFLTREKTPLLALDEVPLAPASVLPGAQITIDFTREPGELQVFQCAYTDLPSELEELPGARSGSFAAPTQPGRYYYKVRAEWPRGFIQYYFALQVQELA